MCLTIPLKIIEIKNNKKALANGLIGDALIDINFLPELKAGDWVLSINNRAFKKIDSNEAKEIIELFSVKQSQEKTGLSDKFQKIIEASKHRLLTKKEVIYLLKTESQEKENLFSEASLTRQVYLKDFICIHGIIEFSNYCKNDCLYCGLRSPNKKIKRYRMSIPEIVKTAEAAVKRGYKLLVLQSGEDYFYTDEMLVEIIQRIKEKSRAFVFMSVGERSLECYEKMKRAGASGALFRFETANQKLFKKMHPMSKSFTNRFQLLKQLRNIGYFIATGSLLGLPGQTLEDLADDILETKKWANMVSTGPFVPAANTPLGQSGARSTKSETKIELNLKMIAILRLLMKDVRIPVTTALETLAGEEGRKKALWSGANALMFNLTPSKYRPHYKIYNRKFFQQDSNWEKYGLFKQEESYQMLEERMIRELKENTIA